jgi:hypothetical protein
MIPIDYTAVVVAAVAAFVVGFLIHGPLFGKLWMKLVNIHSTGKEKFVDMLPQMGWNILANLLAAFCLAHVLYVNTVFFNNAGTLSAGLQAGFWTWLGFNVTATSMDVIWMGKSFKLWLFGIAASLVTYLAMGAVLTLM